MAKKILGFLLLASLAGCAAAVGIPEDKKTYIGDWQGDTIFLSITANGYVSYTRTINESSESINGPITGFRGNTFTVSVFAVTHTFTVQTPPARTDGVWMMTVNGETLEKMEYGVKGTLPARNELKALVNDSFVVFAASIDRKNFGYFYQTISRLWQSQTTVEEIQAAFQSFLDKKVNLRDVTKKRVVFTNQPYINEDNILVVSGYYPTIPVTRFEVQYVYEHPKWMLIGFSCSIE